MMPDANSVHAAPSVISAITGLTGALDAAYDPVHKRMYVTGGESSISILLIRIQVRKLLIAQ